MNYNSSNWLHALYHFGKELVPSKNYDQQGLGKHLEDMDYPLYSKHQKLYYSLESSVILCHSFDSPDPSEFNNEVDIPVPDNPGVIVHPKKEVFINDLIIEADRKYHQFKKLSEQDPSFHTPKLLALKHKSDLESIRDIVFAKKAGEPIFCDDVKFCDEPGQPQIHSQAPMPIPAGRAPRHTHTSIFVVHNIFSKLRYLYQKVLNDRDFQIILVIIAGLSFLVITNWGNL